MRTRPLTVFSPAEMKPLLEAEAAHWRSELFWDYSEVTAAVAAGVARRTLAGRAVEAESGPVAYCYFIQEAGRAVVGSLFSAPAARGLGCEQALLDAVLQESMADPANARVECQTLFSTAPDVDSCFARAGFRSVERHYLVRDLRESLPPAPSLELRRLRKDDLGRAADVIYRSHRGSLDAAVNLTYGTLPHCRSFVDTLALRGGCGSFDADASLVAEGGDGPLAVLLASRLSSRTGHVCQVSVLPGAQGRGLGTALVVAALHAFRRQGHEHASLSVTVENAVAYRLYIRLGFQLRKRFSAHAWVRPPLRLELPA